MGDEDHTVAEQYASLRAVKIYVLDIFILVDVGMSIDFNCVGDHCDSVLILVLLHRNDKVYAILLDPGIVELYHSNSRGVDILYLAAGMI